MRPFFFVLRHAFRWFAVLLAAVRVRPGTSAMLGFALGIATDSLNVEGFGARALALSAIAFAASWMKAIFFDGLLQKSVLDMFFVCLGLWLVARVTSSAASTATWLGLGLAMGGLTLTRENALVFIVVIVAWSILRGRIGTGTREAVRQYQLRTGAIADGWPTPALLALMRDAR